MLDSHDPRDCDEILIRCDGTVGFYIAAQEFSAKWSADLLTPEQILAAAKELAGER